MTPAAVLLVPAEGDRLGLLDEGPCGARPPMAWRCGHCHYNGGSSWYSSGFGECASCGCVDLPGNLRALVLAWDGSVHPYGCLTLAEVLRPGWNHGRTLSRYHTAVYDALHGNYKTIQSIVRTEHSGSRLIFVNAEGEEVEL